eukprot:4076152-Amphidinium_carterae.1
MALVWAAAVGGCGPSQGGQSKKVMGPGVSQRRLRFVTAAWQLPPSPRLRRVSKRLPLLPTGNPRGCSAARHHKGQSVSTSRATSAWVLLPPCPSHPLALRYWLHGTRV